MGRATHGPGMQASARDRCAALALTIVVNAVAGGLLLRVASMAPATGEAETAMEVVWVERPRPAPVPPALAPETREREARSVAPPAVAAVRDEGLSVVEPAAEPDLQIDSPAPGAPERNDPESGSFRHRGVFGPRAADPFAKTGDGIFRMQDASVGGRLQRMAQRSICRELRAQLHGGGGADMDAILRTMAEHGCG
jgi:hypothetical protein